MQILHSAQETQAQTLTLIRQGRRVAFVPTMGALHAGHLKLAQTARTLADFVVMSIFVNPTQFGPEEDFQKYPRTLKRDAELAEAAGVDLIFAPEASEIYPPGDQTVIVVTELSRGLCGPFRPGHFRGVATVVARLFNIVPAQTALFGEKDYQQLAIIRRMVKDLHFPIEIIGVPTLREPDGLAMSSRNAYLLPAERQEALHLYRGLQAAQGLAARGERNTQILAAELQSELQRGKNTRVEYVKVVDSESLAELQILTPRPARLLVAAYVGGTRLIDNVELKI